MYELDYAATETLHGTAIRQHVTATPEGKTYDNPSWYRQTDTNLDLATMPQVLASIVTQLPSLTTDGTALEPERTTKW